jgi:predicted ABC-class ATPase
MHVNVAAGVAGFPAEAFSTKTRAIALADFLCRAFSSSAQAMGADQRVEAGGWSGSKGGELRIDTPGQHVLERSAVKVDAMGNVEARFTCALPARGRSIEGRWASQILGEKVPQLVSASLFAKSLDGASLRKHVLSVEDQKHLRGCLSGMGLVAFVANGAVLPRASGASDKPMTTTTAASTPPVVPFQSPPELEVAVTLPNKGVVKGMGIRRGVTLICGGGFHGKSTLLQALQVGVYDHCPDDGRELVCVDESAVKVRAEDGRSVANVDISPFISNLPFRASTNDFSTEDASGSTSQAASIVEALESGASALLIDEDTAATNFMIRDARMQALVSADKEPITPFIQRVRSLFEQQGVSSVLVVGGAGDYFDVADSVLVMENYGCHDRTVQAAAIAQRFRAKMMDDSLGGGGAAAASSGVAAVVDPFAAQSLRCPDPLSFNPNGGKVVSRGLGKLSFGERELDLGGVEQLVEESQTRAIGDAIRFLAASGSMTNGGGGGGRGGATPLSKVLDVLEAALDGPNGLDALAAPGFPFVGNYARPRRQEVAAALNRLRASSFSHVAAPPMAPPNNKRLAVAPPAPPPSI